MISEHMVPTVKHKEGALRMCEWRGGPPGGDFF